LRSGQVRTVGAILLDIRNPFYTDVARGIEDRLDEEGYTCVFGSSDGDPEREARYLNLFETRGVAGIILAAVCENGDLLAQIADRGLPLVLVEGSFPALQASSVVVDNVAGGGLVANHLAEIGCEHLVMFNGPHEIAQCAARLYGARMAWVAAGRSEDTFHEQLMPTMNVLSGDLAAQEWLAAGAHPKTGLFGVNDLVAMGVQRALRRTGHYNPVDNPIVGFDDIDIVAELATPLTTIRQPTYEIGRRAADLLLGRQAKDPVEQITVRPELVVRTSTVG
jgi:LacI family transcriptional regulator